MNTAWHVPCLRGVFGSWGFYPALLKPAQLSERVISSKEIRETRALDDHLQRDIKPRVKKIVRYLKTRDSRFFNSIIIGVFDGLPNWVEFNLADIGLRHGVPDISEIETSLGILMFNGSEKMFAIDGQHRVEGIKQAFRDFPDRIQDDQISVIFVAHVDDKSGKVRTRRLFCDINKNAVAVSEGDKVIIDEDEISAIVTRRIYAEYPSFQGGDEIAVTERKEQLTEDGRERFTSLLAIHTACKHLKKLFHKTRGTIDHAPDNVACFQTIVSAFLDFIIAEEPTLNRYFHQRVTTLAEERRNNRNLFFRPIGLEVLARLYVYFHAKQGLAVLRKGLNSLQFVNPGGIFDGIIWNAGRIEASAKARNAAFQFCLYLLGEINTDQEASLLSLLREVTKNQSYNLPARRIVRTQEV